MILPDANLLIYAYDSSSPFHDRARRWLEDALSGRDLVLLSWASILAFVRIITHPRAFVAPMSVQDASGIVSEWLGRPVVRVVVPTSRHWAILERLIVDGRARGPLVTDAHLAALAIEHGATLHTTDRDFSRFDDLRYVNPIAD